ncbi:MAG: hypothetical protein Q8M65_03140 [Rhodoglobus sp.]|nr:hypothetical protein [Rhodoglobus sp.]
MPLYRVHWTKPNPDGQPDSEHIVTILASSPAKAVERIVGPIIFESDLEGYGDPTVTELDDDGNPVA